MSHSNLTNRIKYPFVNIPVELDDRSLSVDAIRVYLHLVRRAGKCGEAFPSYRSIGIHCFANDYGVRTVSDDALRRRAIKAVKELIEQNLLLCENRTAKNGREAIANLYVITDVSEWRQDKDREEGGSVQGTPPSVQGTPPSVQGTPPSVQGTPLYISNIPLKKDPSKEDPLKISPLPLSTQQEIESAEGTAACDLDLDEPATDIFPNDKDKSEIQTEKPIQIQNNSSRRSTNELLTLTGQPRAIERIRALAKNHSVKDSPFETVEQEDDFYQQTCSYIKATSPNLNPGQHQAIAQAITRRIRVGNTEPSDRQVFQMWLSGSLGQFQDLHYDQQLEQREAQKQRAMKILSKYQGGSPNA